MQRPHVRITMTDGSIRELEHGDLIGRLWSAALVIDDPRISEAHALVSLREGGFWLLSLRRKIAVGELSPASLAPNESGVSSSTIRRPGIVRRWGRQAQALIRRSTAAPGASARPRRPAGAG